MERGQITRYNGARYCANLRYIPKHASSVKRRKIRFRRKMINMLRVALVVAFIIFVVTSIMIAVINVKVYAKEQREKTESYRYSFTFEEREAVVNAQRNHSNMEILSYEVKEVRAPIALAENTPVEEMVVNLIEENFEVIVMDENEDEHNEGIVENIEEESIEATIEEYKPTKLAGYEISANGPYEHYVYILSEEDMKIIAKLVWMEARGESYEGMVAVAAVVLNRYFSDDQSFSRESILHTVTQKYQFASIWGVTDWDLNNNPDCLNAVKDACRGWDPTRAVFEEGALFFYAPDGVSGYQAEIRQNIKVMVIGNHNFHFDFEKVNG